MSQNTPPPPVRTAAPTATKMITPATIPWMAGAVAGAALSTVALIIGTAIVPRADLVNLGLTGLILVIAASSLIWRTNQRRSLAAELTNQTMTTLKTPLRIVRSRWPLWAWPGNPSSLTLGYPVSFGATHADRTSQVLTTAVSKAAGPTIKTTGRHKRRRRLVVVEFEKCDPNAPTDTASQRIIDVVADTVSASGAARDIVLNDSGEVASFNINVIKASRFTVPTVQRRLKQAITSRLDGRWNTEFDLEHDRIRFARKLPLPTFVLRPVEPVTDDNKVAEAIDEDGNVHYWEVGGVMAHQLRAGRTRTGKTVAMYGDLVECARRGWQIFVLDPKRIEFLGWRGWPNVAMVATSIEDQLVMVNHLHALMDERYRQIEEDGADPAQFHRVLFVIDEYRQFFGMAKAWWAQIKVQGMPAAPPALEQIGSLLRMAAAARIHVLLGTQRPDAEFLAGEVRDNFSARSATGRLSPDGAQMMFDSQQIGVTTPRIQGRGTIVGLDEKPREAQFFYTPDPRSTDHEEQKLLDQLRPTQALWPPLKVVYPADTTVEEVVAQSPRKTSADWERILLASLRPADQKYPAARPASPDPETSATQTLPARLTRTTMVNPFTSPTAPAAPSSRARNHP